MELLRGLRRRYRHTLGDLKCLIFLVHISTYKSF